MTNEIKSIKNELIELAQNNEKNKFIIKDVKNNERRKKFS